MRNDEGKYCTNNLLLGSSATAGASTSGAFTSLFPFVLIPAMVCSLHASMNGVVDDEEITGAPLFSIDVASDDDNDSDEYHFCDVVFLCTRYGRDYSM
jgi:hypothetical protein